MTAGPSCCTAPWTRPRRTSARTPPPTARSSRRWRPGGAISRTRFLRPMRFPRRPLLMTRFGLPALRSARGWPGAASAASAPAPSSRASRRTRAWLWSPRRAPPSGWSWARPRTPSAGRSCGADRRGWPTPFGPTSSRWAAPSSRARPCGRSTSCAKRERSSAT
jgi:hypothetical protein